VTTHEVLATAVTTILKQTADSNTCNKLLKVTKLLRYAEYDRFAQQEALLFLVSFLWIHFKIEVCCLSSEELVQ